MQLQSLATVSTDNCPSELLLATTALEENSKLTVSLNMHAMHLKISG
jgi:hypothetical protein